MAHPVSQSVGVIPPSPEPGGPTATGINLEGGTTKKGCRPPPPQVNFWNSP